MVEWRTGDFLANMMYFISISTVNKLLNNITLRDQYYCRQAKVDFSHWKEEDDERSVNMWKSRIYTSKFDEVWWNDSPVGTGRGRRGGDAMPPEAAPERGAVHVQWGPGGPSRHADYVLTNSEWRHGRRPYGAVTVAADVYIRQHCKTKTLLYSLHHTFYSFHRSYFEISSPILAILGT